MVDYYRSRYGVCSVLNASMMQTNAFNSIGTCFVPFRVNGFSTNYRTG